MSQPAYEVVTLGDLAITSAVDLGGFPVTSTTPVVSGPQGPPGPGGTGPEGPPGPQGPPGQSGDLPDLEDLSLLYLNGQV